MEKEKLNESPDFQNLNKSSEETPVSQNKIPAVSTETDPPVDLTPAVNAHFALYEFKGTEEEIAVQQLNLNKILARDKQLVSGKYLTEDLKTSNPKAYDYLLDATTRAKNFYLEYDKLIKEKDYIEKRKKIIPYKRDLLNTQEEINIFNNEITELDKRINSYSSNWNSLFGEDASKTSNKSLYDGIGDIINLAEIDLSKDKSYNDINFAFDIDTYELLDGKTYRSRGSLDEFDILERSTMDVGLNTFKTKFSTFDELSANIQAVGETFKDDALPIFSKIFEKSFSRLNAKNVLDVDVQNPANLESLVLGIFNFTSASTAQISGVDLSSIKTELDNAGSVAEKNNIMLTYKSDLQKVMQNMQPAELQKLYESTENLFNNSFYFENNSQKDDFYNKLPTEIGNINEYNDFYEIIENQAAVQYRTEVNAIYQNTVENIVNQNEDSEKLDPRDYYELFMTNYFANNLFTDNKKNTLGEIMKMFEAEYKEEINDSKALMQNLDFKELRFIETGSGGGKFLTEEDLLNYETRELTRNVKTVDNKKIQKELKRLQKKYEKSPLPDNFVYLENKDADGNLYYDTEVVNRDSEGNVVDTKGGVPITNPKDVKRIQNSLRTKDEIEQLIENDLRNFEFNTSQEQAPGKAEDLIKNAAIDVFAAMELNMMRPSIEEGDFDDDIQAAHESSVGRQLWTGAKSIGDIILAGPSTWINPEKQFDIFATKLMNDTSRAAFKNSETSQRAKILFVDLLRDSGTGPDEYNIRNDIYAAWSGVTVGIQEQLSKVKVESVFPNSPYAGKDGSGDFGTTNQSSPGIGINSSEALIKNYTNINRNIPSAEKTKAVNKLLEIIEKNLKDVMVMPNEFDYTGLRFKNQKETEKSYEKFKSFINENTENLTLNYYPLASEKESSAYEFKAGDKTFTIYADTKQMIKSGDLFATKENSNPDYKILDIQRDYNFSKLDTEDFKKNMITIDQENNIIWNYTDVDGEKYTDTTGIKFNSTTTIQELESYIKTMLELED